MVLVVMMKIFQKLVDFFSERLRHLGRFDGAEVDSKIHLCSNKSQSGRGPGRVNAATKVALWSALVLLYGGS